MTDNESRHSGHSSGCGMACPRGGAGKRIRVAMIVAAIAMIAIAQAACRKEQPAKATPDSAGIKPSGVASDEGRDQAIPAAAKSLETDPAQRAREKNPLLDRMESGKPAVLIFSMRTCCGADPAASIVAGLQARHSNTLHVVHVDAFGERSTALKCGVETIPTIVLYDAQGNEKARLIDPWDVDEIEEKMREVGME